MADLGGCSSSFNSRSSSSDDKDGVANKFANDGSFMEMFRRKMEEEKAKKTTENNVETPPQSASPPLAADPSPSSSSSTAPSAYVVAAAPEPVNKPSKPLPFVGKRRGAVPVLKTGAVKKAKKEQEEETPKKDAWSQYLAEVKKYKEQSCQEENKTRPLVK